MTELFDGLILTVDQAQNGNFTYKGKPVKLEQDKNNSSLYRARTKLTKEEKENGNREVEIVYNVGVATGTVSTYVALPDDSDKDFKGLTDSEKITKMNSIAYQFGTEPTDKGNQLDHVLQNSVDTTPAQDKQTALQKQQTAKNKSAGDDNDSENVKSGDKIEVNKK